MSNLATYSYTVFNQFVLYCRYLLFNVNPGEGFNLRRDVYLRIANLVHKLNDIEPWTLVLPPWGNLYHWKNTPRLVFYPWGEFFDIGSLQKWIPVMEFEDFWNGENGHVDSAYILQNFEDMWEKEWVERYEVAKCFDKQVYRKNSDGKWFNNLWNRPVIFSNFSCLSFQGMAKTIIPFLTKDIKNSK
ncbi:UNVERIFIED_CONTAM: hypothetical protein GTU68_046435 [Idotea baltica]|nr:hypothetical protein [Idotea baltica]